MAGLPWRSMHGEPKSNHRGEIIPLNKNDINNKIIRTIANFTT